MKKSESTVKNVKVIRFQGPSRTAQLPANTRPTVASRTSGRCPPLNLTDSIYKGKHLGKIHTHLSKILNSFKLEKVSSNNVNLMLTKCFSNHARVVASRVSLLAWRSDHTTDSPWDHMTPERYLLGVIQNLINVICAFQMMLATPWLLAVFLAVAALASPSPAINEIRQPSNKPGRFLSLPVPNKCAQRSRGIGGKCASRYGWPREQYTELSVAQEAVVVSVPPGLASRTVCRAFSGSRDSDDKCASQYGWPREQYTELSVAQEAVMVSVPPGRVTGSSLCVVTRASPRSRLYLSVCNTLFGELGYSFESRAANFKLLDAVVVRLEIESGDRFLAKDGR
uniref:Uncharacterized protein n=1 Tax=Timema poppense TaxID=170557 RepID=A0A7R9CR23_TIMPO|nr:unnamed protein product [Timema poppensis]